MDNATLESLRSRCRWMESKLHHARDNRRAHGYKVMELQQKLNEVQAELDDAKDRALRYEDEISRLNFSIEEIKIQIQEHDVPS